MKLSVSQSTKKEIGGRVEGKMRVAVVAEEEGGEDEGSIYIANVSPA